MFTCDKCESATEVKHTCPSCGAAFCEACIKTIKESGNRCPECGVSPDAELRRNADKRTRGNPF